jgi:hypothetical protein
VGSLGFLLSPLPHGALHADGGLLVDGLDGVEHLLGLHHDLGGAVEVPEDHEGEVAADLADVFHPADQLDALAGVGEAKLAAVVGSGLHHVRFPLFF